MTETTDKSGPLPEAVHQFVLQWGNLGDRWGVNRSVSQIHALLYASERPLTADDIAEALDTVQRAEPLVERIITGKSYYLRVTGAQVWFAAQRGFTAQWLERTLECHQARRVLENPASAGDVDPFWLEDGWVDIQVRPASAAFIAQLRGRTFDQADVINSRAQSFVASLEAK